MCNENPVLFSRRHFQYFATHHQIIQHRPAAADHHHQFIGLEVSSVEMPKQQLTIQVNLDQAPLISCDVEIMPASVDSRIIQKR